MNKLSVLKKENADLAKSLEHYKSKYEQSREAYDHLLHAFKQTQRREFGQSSERYIDTQAAQADMFSDVPAQPLSEEDEEPEPDEEQRPRTKKKKTKRNGFAKSLPRREVIIPAENKGPDDKVIRYEETELLNYIPAVYEIIVQKREVVISKHKETNVTEMIIAPNPKRFLQKASVTETFLANMVVSKLYDRQPLYHLEKKFAERFDFICPRNKLARWFIQSAAPLQPLINLLKDTMLDYDVMACDPTHLHVLDEPGREASKKSYLFTFQGGPPQQSVVLYEYNAQDHKIFLQHWFEGYQGYLLADGQNIFDVFDKHSDITMVFCNSHARRKFEPIAKASKKFGLASEAMQFYKSLYKLERQATTEQMTPSQRYALRLEKTQPLVDAFETWLEEKGPLTLPQSPLGLAFQYVSKRTAGLRRFLEDGRLEIDTNLLEQKNKNLALARNNFLFAQSVAGAKALSIHMTLVFTAILHKLDPYHYYVHIMQRIPHCQTIEDYEALLPWNVNLAHVQDKAA